MSSHSLTAATAIVHRQGHSSEPNRKGYSYEPNRKGYSYEPSQKTFIHWRDNLLVIMGANKIATSVYETRDMCSSPLGFFIQSSSEFRHIIAV